MRARRVSAVVVVCALGGLARCATSSGSESDSGADGASKPDGGDAGAADAGFDASSADVTRDVVDDASSSDAGDAGAIDAGDASDSGPTTEALVFTTSQTYTGALGGLSGADAKCQALATQANLPGTYKAWLSDGSGSPSTRFTHSTVPYKLVDGTVVANDWTSLVSGTLQHAIDKSESNGAPGKDNSGLSLPTGVTLVWTSTKFDGTAVSGTDCLSWTSSASNQPSEWGRDDATNAYWSQWASSGSCGWVAPLMCFQQ